ncbi:hypothetical protein QR680_010098 [Steinernema hermaphroditum]|uniref:G-protein coupled receptors family 1 profile domain-containing protein n=1 Tax=Steinernema hermaphroditum TaxID=289476 RepID=A0AA39MAX6_9BILA|nr:hypothetical protein QR680_010098 [Steinernema hermaphroditum]
MNGTIAALFYSLAFVFSAIGFLLNIRLVVIYLVQANASNKCQLTMVFLVVAFHLIYNVSSMLYTGYCLNGIRSGMWNNFFVFWLGNSTSSCSLVTMVCNLCTAVDRLLAMRQPFDYSFKLARRCKLASLTIIVTMLFGTSAVFYMGHVQNDALVIPSFSMLVKSKTIGFITIGRAAFCLLSIGITIAFALELRRFTKGHQNHNFYNSLRTANTIVAYHLAADFALGIVPAVIALAFNSLMNINLVAKRNVGAIISTYATSLVWTIHYVKLVRGWCKKEAVDQYYKIKKEYDNDDIEDDEFDEFKSVLHLWEQICKQKLPGGVWGSGKPKAYKHSASLRDGNCNNTHSKRCFHDSSHNDDDYFDNYDYDSTNDHNHFYNNNNYTDNHQYDDVSVNYNIHDDNASFDYIIHHDDNHIHNNKHTEHYDDGAFHDHNIDSPNNHFLNGHHNNASLDYITYNYINSHSRYVLHWIYNITEPDHNCIDLHQHHNGAILDHYHSRHHKLTKNSLNNEHDGSNNGRSSPVRYVQ